MGVMMRESYRRKMATDRRPEMGVGRTQAIFTFAVIAVVLWSLAFRIAAAR